MFYSHQLLARKAPLGQIWMAATMHAKINRRKLDKLNIIKICEEILNPSVPMALRLSGILMGGVVIVYERKVKILYEDVTRLLVEINEAWKVKAAPEATVIPKGKSVAKKEAATRPKKDPKDVGDHEAQSINFSYDTSPMKFQQTAFFTMRLDSVDEPYIHEKTVEDDASHNFHQTDAENITLLERFDMYQSNTNTFNRFERFDIEDDEDTQSNFASVDQTKIPDTFGPSPPQDKYQEGSPEAEVQDQHLERDVIQQAYESKELRQVEQVAIKRKTKRTAAFLMDYEKTIIPGHIYQSWLKDVSDLISRRGKKRKRTGAMSSMKIATLMDLPPVVLSGRLFTDGSREVYYPAPLLELWMKSIRNPPDSPSVRNSAPLPPEPSLSSLPERVNFPDHMDFAYENQYSGVGSQSFGASIEKLRTKPVNDDIHAEILLEELRPDFMNNVMGMAERNQVVTPGNSGIGVRSVSSSASEHGVFVYNPETNSVRSNKKRPYYSSRQSSGGLEPVAEENPWHHSDPNFKLARLSENDPDLLVETAPTQTQVTQPAIKNPPADKITNSIRMQMKAHFNTPGAPPAESLNNLAAGMNPKAAAMLFYQTCVLASSDYLKVNQQVPFGDIFISKGTKM
ncbi:sister chromatid cohesion 1 protein 1-like isoform X1 [Cucurbita maxima]|uniref:Sister chromatid cohesion 1 protein 1-like isoform X1 n=1 Tax=Cucurbita maxima TaxID=3661 RepID=A0A6J1JET8_CUCMA|nr:sister chromatid cohesion 1 protein 1-like isoform X1 [Cucurbita maxima]